VGFLSIYFGSMGSLVMFSSEYDAITVIKYIMLPLIIVGGAAIAMAKLYYVEKTGSDLFEE